MKFTNPHCEPVSFGFIGGSGVYELDCMQNPHYYEIETPFGKPSGPVCIAKIEGVYCAFLARHGTHHTYTPSEVNYRANICAMKQLGVKYLIGINAVGSLDERYKPGDFALVSQIIDRTWKREVSFFGNGIVAHFEFACPTSKKLSELSYKAMRQCFIEDNVEFLDGETKQCSMASSNPASFRVHPSATLVVIEGPHFSTKAESLAHKQSGGNLIGMTSFPEARLAREAEMAYTIIAMVTDMDSWYDAPHVGLEGIIKVMKSNTAKVKRLPPVIIRGLQSDPFQDPAHNAIEYSIVTSPEHVSTEVKERLAPLLREKYPRYAA